VDAAARAIYLPIGIDHRGTFRDVRKTGAAVLLGLSAAACGGDETCFVPPCALPIAISVSVASSTGPGVVPGAAVVVSGAVVAAVPCASSCTVPGYAGTYNLRVGAPGYQDAERTVVVQGSDPACGCRTADTQQVSFVLLPAP
jgi:hypothetical protein